MDPTAILLSKKVCYHDHMKKCTEPNFKKLTKRTTLSTGMLLQCLIMKSFKSLTQKIKDAINAKHKE